MKHSLTTMSVVAMAAGGMHCVALTHDNKILGSEVVGVVTCPNVVNTVHNFDARSRR